MSISRYVMFCMFVQYMVLLGVWPSQNTEESWNWPLTNVLQAAKDSGIIFENLFDLLEYIKGIRMPKNRTSFFLIFF